MPELTTTGTAGQPGQGAPSTPTPGRRTLRDRLHVQSTLGRHALLMLLALVGIVVLVQVLPGFRGSQLAAMAYYVPAAAGLTLLTGVNGQISLGHGALMAVGAYTTAVLLRADDPLPFVVVLLLSVLMAMVVGLVVGAAASRLHGPYLAGATLALAVGLPGIALYFEGTDELGGEQGIRVSPPGAPEWFEDASFFITGSDLSGTAFQAYLGWGVALVVLLLLSNLVRSRYGRVWRAVRDDEVAAELAGIDLGRARVLAFVVSAACAGAGGALLAITSRLAAPTSFTLVLSISLLVAIVLGGLGSLLGAVVGSGVIVFLAPAVTNLGRSLGFSDTRAADIAPLVYGITLIVVILLAPQGLVGTLRLRWLQRRARRAA